MEEHIHKWKVYDYDRGPIMLIILQRCCICGEFRKKKMFDAMGGYDVEIDWDGFEGD
jgi:hypothetical protein